MSIKTVSLTYFYRYFLKYQGDLDRLKKMLAEELKHSQDQRYDIPEEVSSLSAFPRPTEFGEGEAKAQIN